MYKIQTHIIMLCLHNYVLSAFFITSEKEICGHLKTFCRLSISDDSPQRLQGRHYGDQCSPTDQHKSLLYNILIL